jgi:sporulation protein YqfC
MARHPPRGTFFLFGKKNRHEGKGGAYNRYKVPGEGRNSMTGRNGIRPAKHKHQKKLSTAPSKEDPVVQKKIADKLGIQEDILGKAPVLTSFGRYRVCIENYRSILQYEENRIRIQTKQGKIQITGENLGIAYYREECMCVVGVIRSIEYQ